MVEGKDVKVKANGRVKIKLRYGLYSRHRGGNVEAMRETRGAKFARSNNFGALRNNSIKGYELDSIDCWLLMLILQQTKERHRKQGREIGD